MNQPNILCVLLDTVRTDHLSCYGYERPTTPFIDSFAELGVRYDNIYSTSIWSLPAYASLFTGELPSTHGAVDWGRAIEQNGLVDGLHEAGYSSGVVSPHLVSGEFGIQDAFEITRWIQNGSDYVLFEDDPVIERIRERLDAEGWDTTWKKAVDVLKWTITERSFKTVPNIGSYVYQSARDSLGWWDDDGAANVVNQTADVIERLEEPYFLFANFIEPHGPYRPPRSHLRDFLADDVSRSELNAVLEKFSPTTELILGDVDLTEREREALVGLYDAELAYLDQQVEELLTPVELEDTVVILLSDHGDLFGEWGLWAHQGRIHNRLAHVPLIIKYPWLSSDTKDEIGSTASLHNHMLDIAASSTDSRLAFEPSGTAFIEYFGWDTHQFAKPWVSYENESEDPWGMYQASVVEDKYRLLWLANGTRELYDVKADPQETTDVAGANPKRVDELSDKIVSELGNPESIHQQYRASQDMTAGNGRDIDEDVRGRLEELGYMD